MQGKLQAICSVVRLLRPIPKFTGIYFHLNSAFAHMSKTILNIRFN